MAGVDSIDRLICALGADLTPVRRLASPALRALGWLAIVGAIGIALATVTDLLAMMRRLAAALDMWLAVIGSTLTAVLAVLAAFELSLPDRKTAWALLPLPTAAVWVSASGLGCLRQWLIPDTHPATPQDAQSCLAFILCISIPLSILLIALLRRACSLRPNLAAPIGGLACASAAATLLNFVHPYDAAATDLAVHALAAVVVVVANRAMGGRRILASQKNIFASV
jgi:hypothetical protein